MEDDRIIREHFESENHLEIPLKDQAWIYYKLGYESALSEATAENERLRGALQDIADLQNNKQDMDIAVKALSTEGEKE